MNDQQKTDEVLDPVELGRRGAVRKILLGTVAYAVPAAVSFSMDSLGGAAEAHPARSDIPRSVADLYAILDVVTAGSILHHVVSIDISEPNNISYLPIGSIAGFADKYFVSATLDSI